MKKTALVIMAAGIGSRFGKGIKQLAPVGPNGEIIMDYSIHDALEAGFNKVVFIIRKDLEEEFRRVIGERIEKITEVEYAFQALEDLPAGFEKPADRTKPWGTGQAVLAAKAVLNEPFMVINADDYYGKSAFKEAYSYLTSIPAADKIQVCMVGFVLKNTLSENGGVTRGICRVDENGMLQEIIETHNIEKDGNRAVVREGDVETEYDVNSPVSMNMWGLTTEFFTILKTGFEQFLNETDSEDLKAEYLLPTIIGELLKKEAVNVKVLKSEDQWFGVTYKEDRETVVEAVKSLVDKGVYPDKL